MLLNLFSSPLHLLYQTGFLLLLVDSLMDPRILLVSTPCQDNCSRPFSEDYDVEKVIILSDYE